MIEKIARDKKGGERGVGSVTKTGYERERREREQGPRLCCGQHGSVRADIKVQGMDRDERGKVWKPYETTGKERERE